MTRELLARNPRPGATLDVHGWTLTLGRGRGDATVCHCPEHATTTNRTP